MDTLRIENIILKRYILVIMGCVGFVNIYALRANLSLAIVSMVNSSSTDHFDNSSMECPYPEVDISTNSSNTPNGKFSWDGETQGFILSGFFYGYIITQIPGGLLASKFGGKIVFGLGVLSTGIFTLFTPIAAELGPNAIFFLRLAEGFGEGFTVPAMFNLLAKWIPPLERSKLAAIAFSGTHLGTVISQSLSGTICDKIGWQWVFYIFGMLAIVWFIFWIYLIADSPNMHSTVTFEECIFIETSIGEHFIVHSVPWLSILKSLPFWSIFVAHFCNNWGFYTLLTCLPKYLSDVLHFDIKADGLISSLPYLFQWMIIILTGQIADYLRYHEVLSTTNTRKIFNTIGLMAPAICLSTVSYLGCNRWMIIGMLIVACGGAGFNSSGHAINLLDIAPTYAGVLFGIINCFATIPGFVSPQIVGYLTQENSTIIQWRKIFYISASIYTFGALFYVLFASGMTQRWAEIKDSFYDETDLLDEEINEDVDDSIFDPMGRIDC